MALASLSKRCLLTGSFENWEGRICNHKSTPTELRIVEHVYRWTGWVIVKNSDAFKKVDSKTLEFTVPIPPEEEKTGTHKVHNSW